MRLRRGGFERERDGLEFINFLLKKKEIRDEYRADKFQNERELNLSRSKSDIFSIASIEAYSKRNE